MGAFYERVVQSVGKGNPHRSVQRYHYYYLKNKEALLSNESASFNDMDSQIKLHVFPIEFLPKLV